MIKGLYETHLKVAYLERSMEFYGKTLGLPFALFEEKRRIAFYWIGEGKRAMLGLWESPPETIQRQHFAFSVDLEDMWRSVDYLKARGLTPRNFLDDGTERPMVFAWMPAIAIYFDDPDGHELEFIALLPDEPHPELGVVSWETWNNR